jgi:hypothetical protein
MSDHDVRRPPVANLFAPPTPGLSATELLRPNLGAAYRALYGQGGGNQDLAARIFTGQYEHAPAASPVSLLQERLHLNEEGIGNEQFRFRPILDLAGEGAAATAARTLFPVPEGPAAARRSDEINETIEAMVSHPEEPAAPASE